jgi:molybdate transport system substrate-binding protein
VKRNVLVLTLLSAVLLFAGCSQKTATPAPTTPVAKKTITVSAAASLQKVMTEIEPAFQKETGIKVSFNFGSSGTLQKQIEQGAPTDVFISAGKSEMDALQTGKLIDNASRKNLLTNKLVLIVPNDKKGKIKTAEDLVNNADKISIGEPKSVPAGEYAQASLTYLNLWNKLSSKVVYAKDVEQVVTYVESGSVDGGFVYNSDAVSAGLKNSSVVETMDAKTHKPIVYPEAIITASKDKVSAKAFMDYLNTAAVEQIFEKYGFGIPTK